MRPVSGSGDCVHRSVDPNSCLAGGTSSFVEYSFSDLVAKDIREDEEYRREHLACGLETFLEGDSVTAQLMLRDFVKGTIGFEELGRRLGKSPKSLMRMLSAKGNPRADNLAAIIATLAACAGLELKVQTAPRAGGDREPEPGGGN